MLNRESGDFADVLCFVGFCVIGVAAAGVERRVFFLGGSGENGHGFEGLRVRGRSGLFGYGWGCPVLAGAVRTRASGFLHRFGSWRGCWDEPPLTDSEWLCTFILG